MRRAALTILAIAALALVACGRPPVDEARCAEIDAKSLGPLAEGMQRAGRFRNAFTVQSADGGGVWLVSVELVRQGQDPDVGGDIYTFATATDPKVATTSDYVSVDPNARDYSTWPTNDTLSVKMDGAIESRACVHRVRPSRGNTGILGGN